MTLQQYSGFCACVFCACLGTAVVPAQIPLLENLWKWGDATSSLYDTSTTHILPESSPPTATGGAQPPTHSTGQRVWDEGEDPLAGGGYRGLHAKEHTKFEKGGAGGR